MNTVTCILILKEWYQKQGFLEGSHMQLWNLEISF